MFAPSELYSLIQSSNPIVDLYKHQVVKPIFAMIIMVSEIKYIFCNFF